MENFLCEEYLELINRRKREIEYLRSRVFDTDDVVAESEAMQQALFKAHAVA